MNATVAPQNAPTAAPGQGASYSSNAPQSAATAPREVNLYEAITYLNLAQVLAIAAAAAPVQ